MSIRHPELPIDITLADDEHAAFIKTSWLRSYRYADWVQGIESDAYYTGHSQIVERLLDGSICAVAQHRTNTEQLYGFACGDRIGDKFVLHYVYVKSPFRRNGIGKALVETVGYNHPERITGTHKTWVDSKTGFVRGKYCVEYNPYVLNEVNVED